MTLILDAGGISALAGHRARLFELRRTGQWPPQIPAIVLAEALTGDHRRDFHTNHLLRVSLVRDVSGSLAREAALLRTQTGRPGEISATDAVVAAFAGRVKDPVILTSDPVDLQALINGADSPVVVLRV